MEQASSSTIKLPKGPCKDKGHLPHGGQARFEIGKNKCTYMASFKRWGALSNTGYGFYEHLKTTFSA
jgi:hypothetical protein